MQTVLVPGHHSAVDAWISPRGRLNGAVSYDLAAGEMLLQFAVGSFRKARIESAELRVNALQWLGQSGDLSVAALRSEWDPRTVSWDVRSGVIPWASPGGQELIDIGAWGSVSGTLSAAASILAIDVTEAVQSWVSGLTRNRGWLLSGSVRVGGARNPSLAARPRLFLRYSQTETSRPGADAGLAGGI